MGIGKGFDANKAKVHLKLAVNRFNLHISKKSNLNKIEKRNLSQLLDKGKEDLARIRVENIIREDLLMEAYELCLIFCELLSTRMSLIQHSKKCPPDMEEAVKTLMWACVRVENPELRTAMKIFKERYGKEFAQEALENKNDCVNERVVAKMSISPPKQFLVVSYLNEIATMFGVDWHADPDDFVDEEETLPPLQESFGMKPLQPMQPMQPGQVNPVQPEFPIQPQGQSPGGSDPSYGVREEDLNLPTVPQGMPKDDDDDEDGGSNVPDFDDLTSRFDALKKRR